jgi:hypothetical protein
VLSRCLEEVLLLGLRGPINTAWQISRLPSTAMPFASSKWPGCGAVTSGTTRSPKVAEALC